VWVGWHNRVLGKGEFVMKMLVGLFFVTTVVFGALYFVERRDAASENKGLLGKLKSSTSHRKSDGLAIHQLEDKNKLLQKSVAELKTQLSEVKDDLKESQALASKSEKGEVSNQEVVPSESMGSKAMSMMNTPAMKKMIRDMEKRTRDKQYADLYKDLGLSGEDLEAFKELLLREDMSEMRSLGMAMMQGKKVDEKMKEATEKMAAAEKVKEGKIQELLGKEGYNSYEEYKKVLYEREEVADFKSRLSTPELLLTKSQEKDLIQAIHKMKQESSPLFGGSKDDALEIPKSKESMMAMMKERSSEEYIKKQKESARKKNESLLESARNILHPEQWEKFKVFRQEKLKETEAAYSMMRAGMSMFKEEKTDEE